MARSSSATPIRRFIRLLIDDCDGGYTLRKIDTAPFFAAGVCPQMSAASPEAMDPAPLPFPVARFECAPGHKDSTQFFPLCRSGDKIVGVNQHRHTIICDTRTTAVRAGSDMRNDKRSEIAWAEAGSRLYLLGCSHAFDPPSFDFEALSYDRRRDDWIWSTLPLPPFEAQTGRIVSFADAADGASSGEIIRVSTRCNGTYAFDTARGSWRREGDWALPFNGHAQYVADYGLWFGFSDQGAFDLCAADLTCATAGTRLPYRHVWADVDGLGNHVSEWLRGPGYLSYLGCGRFCVTRFLTTYRSFGKITRHIAVVTAVEATLAAGGEEMRLVRRASRCYHFSVPASRGWVF
ncbi:uncharacterized protein LOC133914083 [Phragmites australis]|uniref:uncharacterized protein LOC133914083 n=1 Tax=Phragmites australis TaxID=29695 RepID=UPI002D783902|nr:uncharacterized protein LOC133914083 [Phragmites australis]